MRIHMARLSPRTLTAPVCLAGLVLFSALPTLAAAQDSNLEIDGVESYEDLWKRGAYHEALKQLEAMLATLTGRGHNRLHYDHAQLLFEVGKIDHAIGVMEMVANEQYEPKYYVDLAMMHKYRGRLDAYQSALDRAQATARGSWRYRNRDSNYIALWRVYEIKGENPKTLLSTSFQSLFDKKPNFHPAYIGAGDLAYRYRAYDIAEGHYKKALEIQADNQDALAGLVKCYWKSNDPRLEETLDTLLEFNPNHPEANAIVAERKLDMGRAEEALEVIDAMLEINPVRLRARALQAAAYFLLDEHEKLRNVQMEALKFNPYASEVFRIPGRIASRRYRFEEGARFQSRALTVDPKDHEARALHGFDLLRLGKEEEGRKELEQAFEGDPYNVQVYNMLKVLDHVDSFTRIERGPFVVQLPPDEEVILAEDVFGILDNAFDTYTTKYDADLETPVLVQLFDSHDDFMVRSVGLPGNTGYLGICFGRLLTMDSPSARPKWAVNWRSVLLHEFVHVITLQKTHNRMPRWLSEGISVYEETEYATAWGQRMDVNYKPIVEREPLPGLSDMEAYFSQPKTPNHLMFGYFLAGEFVRFYVDTYGFDALPAALEAIGNGEDAEPALATAAERSIEEVDADFKDFLTARFEPYDNLPAIHDPEEVKPGIFDWFNNDSEESKPWKERNSAFTNALRKAESAWKDEKWAVVEHELKRAYELYPEYTGPDAPLRQLIKLYDKQGDTKKLRDTLEKQLAMNPTDFPACRRLIQLHIDSKDWKAAAEVADWAMGIDPFDAPLRKALLQGQLRAKHIGAALHTLTQLAHLDASRAPEYNLHRANLLVHNGKLADAKRETLHVLEQTPYFWDAQALLLHINEKQERSVVENP